MDSAHFIGAQHVKQYFRVTFTHFMFQKYEITEK